MMDAAEQRTFNPGIFLTGSELPAGVPQPDLLILNQPISNFDVFSQLWKHSNYRICADGGANRLYDMFQGALEARRDDYRPHSIHGDLDSLQDDVRKYYESRGVVVSQDPNQYNTDFAKTMEVISSRSSPHNLRQVLVLGTLGGRVDQGLGLLHELIREEMRDPTLRLWLVSESSITFILRPGQTIVEGLMSTGLFTENMGLVPIYGPATITTSGLEWDVKEWETSMGTQVSTSNHVISDAVHVHTNAPILFTIERKPFEGAGVTGKGGDVP